MKKNTYLTYKIEKWLFASNSKEVRRILDIKYLESLKKHQGNKSYEAEIIEKIKLIKNIDHAKTEDGKNNCLLILESKGLVNQQVGVAVTKVNKLIDEDELTYIEKPQIGILYDDYFVEKYAMLDNEIIGIIDVNRIVNKNIQCKRRTQL